MQGNVISSEVKRSTREEFVSDSVGSGKGNPMVRINLLGYIIWNYR